MVSNLFKIKILTFLHFLISPKEYGTPFEFSAIDGQNIYFLNMQILIQQQRQLHLK